MDATALELNKNYDNLAEILTDAMNAMDSLDKNIYIPTGGEFYDGTSGNQIKVCLAGALIANQLADNPKIFIDQDIIPSETKRQLFPIELLRESYPDLALLMFYDQEIDPDNRNNVAAYLNSIEDAYAFDESEKDLAETKLNHYAMMILETISDEEAELLSQPYRCNYTNWETYNIFKDWLIQVIAILNKCQPEP